MTKRLSLLLGLVALGAVAAFGGVAPAEAAALGDLRGSLGPLAPLAFGGLVVNAANLRTLYTGFKATFQRAFQGAKPMWNRVAMKVPSTTRTEEYGWLGLFPKVREWIGDRVINRLSAHRYQVTNKDWELTIGVKASDIKDDTFGLYTPLFAELGRSAAEHPDELVFALLKAGHQMPCYDGQNFFDTDHPVIGEDGTEKSVSNYAGGAGHFWCLLDVSRELRPLLFQDREAFDFVRMDAPTDDAAFMRNEYVYGTQGRSNVGFGLWQLAYGSRQELTAANYAAAFAAMEGMKGDQGRVLGIRPGLLVVSPALREAAQRLLTSEHLPGGESNPWKGTAELLVVPWLA